MREQAGMEHGARSGEQAGMEHGAWSKERGAGSLDERQTTVTELGLEVPEKPGDEWREHTAERWKERDPQTYEQCIHLIKSGLTNQSELARVFGKSRNTIQALMMSDVFGRGEINAIIERAALIGTAQMQDKLMELTDKAKSTKDLGAVAMGLTTMHNIKQISAGGPTQVKEVRHKFDVTDFETKRAQKLTEGMPIVDVLDAQVVRVVRQEGES